MDWAENYFHQISGHLEIIKIKDNKEEVLFDDHNVIVSGMSVGISTMMALSGSQSVLDFHLDRVQFGIGTQTEASTVFQLSEPLSSTTQYGSNANLNVVSSTLIKNGVPFENHVFVLIPFHNVSRISETSVRYTIILDENSANSFALREIGLFMKNPFGKVQDSSILTAYRTYSSITKSSDFALVFRWTINF